MSKRQILGGLAAIVVILSFSGEGSTAAATRVESSGELRAELTARLQSILKEVDPAGQVSVRVTQKKSTIALPGTAFTLTDHELVSASKFLRFAEARVQILASTPNLPAGVVSIMQTVGREYAEVVSVDTSQLPADYLAARQKLIDSAKVTSRPWDNQFGNALASLRAIEQKGRLFAFGAAGLCLAVAIGLMVLGRRRDNSVMSSLNSGFTLVSKAFENGGMSQPVLSRPTATKAESTSNRREYDSSDGVSQAKDIRDLPPAGLMALIMDCYWSAEDHYAAFIWQQMSAGQKVLILSSKGELRRYFETVAGIEPIDLGLDRHPSYLDPLGYDHLDNGELRNIVLKHPQLFNRLTPIRARSIDLKPSERIRLMHESTAGDTPNHNFAGYPPSKLRSLKPAIQLEVRSVQDEMEVIELADQFPEVIKQVPSLAWLLRLPPEDQDEILKSMSARQLAEAWTGPQDVLDALAKRLNPSKVSLLESTLEKVTPSRDSDAFLMIHSRVVAKLEDSNAVSRDADSLSESSHAAA